MFVCEQPLPNENAKSFEVVSEVGMNGLLFQLGDERPKPRLTNAPGPHGAGLEVTLKPERRGGISQTASRQAAFRAGCARCIERPVIVPFDRPCTSVVTPT